MNILNARRVGYALCMAALLAAGLSTGTRLYYLVFFMLLAMLLLGLVSAAWTLWSVMSISGSKRFLSREGFCVPLRVVIFLLLPSQPLSVLASRNWMALKTAMMAARMMPMALP